MGLGSWLEHLGVSPVAPGVSVERLACLPLP